MLNLSSKDFLRVLITVVGLFCIIATVDSRNHQTPLYYTRNHQPDGLHHPVASKNCQTISRRKRSDFIVTPEPFFYNKSMNIHSINPSTSTQRIINDVLPEKISKIGSSNVGVTNNNDSPLDELEKLFGVIQNKSRVSKLTKNNPIASYDQMERDDSKSNNSPPLSLASCKYLRDLEKSFTAKVVAFEKMQSKINRKNKVVGEKRLKRDVKNEIEVNEDNEINSKMKVRPIRNADNNLNLKIQLDDIYPDTVVNVDDGLPLVNLIRTKRFGDAGHESDDKQKDVKTHENIKKSSGQRRNYRNAGKSSEDSKALELLQDLQNLAQNIVAKITDIQRSIKIATRLERYSQRSSSLTKSPKSINQVSRFRRCGRHKHKITFHKT